MFVNVNSRQVRILIRNRIRTLLFNVLSRRFTRLIRVHILRTLIKCSVIRGHGVLQGNSALMLQCILMSRFRANI